MSACLVVNQWTSDMWTTNELNPTFDAIPIPILRQARELAGAPSGPQQVSNAPRTDRTQWNVMTVTTCMMRLDSRFDRGKLLTN